MSASKEPKWTTSRIFYEDTGRGGVKRFKATRTDKYGFVHVGTGDTKPHAKADLRLRESEAHAKLQTVLSATQPQPAAE